MSFSLRHETSSSISTRARIWIALLALFALVMPLAAAPAHAVDDDQLRGGGVLPESQHYRVAPGLELTKFSRLEQAGWNNGAVLTADLTEPTLSMDVVDGGNLTQAVTLTDMMKNDQHSGTPVAGINGTFFDINSSNAPLKTSVASDGIRVGTDQPEPALTVSGAQAAIRELTASGTVTINGQEHALSGVNRAQLPENGIGVFTSVWGSYSLDRPVSNANSSLSPRIARASVVDGVVTDVSGMVAAAGDPNIDEGTQVLLGREDGADAVASLKVGDRVDIAVAPSADIDMGIVGSGQILKDGEVVQSDDGLSTNTHPRTAVGVSRDGSTVYALVIDGRSAQSRGMTLPEIAQLLKDMGAANALNLDGGGSSTMAARVAGADGPTVANIPSDGHERALPNSVMFYSTAPSTDLSDVQISAAVDGADTVFPGLHRTFNATGLASDLAPVMTEGTFGVGENLELSQADSQNAVVIGVSTGHSQVTYDVGPHHDSADLRVLGELRGLTPSERSITLTDTADQSHITLTGFDGDGRTAVIENADVTAEVSDGFELHSEGLNQWAVSADGSARSGQATFTVADMSVTVPLSFGTRTETIWDFSEPDAFKWAGARATGQIEAAEGPADADGAPTHAMRVTHDFTNEPATRGSYITAKEPTVMDSTVVSFSVDIKGDGTGVWPRLEIKDAADTIKNLDGEHINFTDWKTITFTVPDGLAQPVTVQALRFMETRKDAQYHGDLTAANLRATVIESAGAPETSPVHDPSILATGSVDDRAQRIAVMSDAQFVAKNPTSEYVEGARRTLREIKAAKPDLLVINGDFLDEASPEDFALAQQILDEEWDSAIPYIYVPGNHEVMGASLENFTNEFGAPQHERKLGRTQIVTLDTSSGSLRGGGIDQIAHLEQILRSAASSDTVTGVLVFFHHPTRDPLAGQASQLGDQREARAIEKLLSDFQDEFGKSAAVINGHVGVFHGAGIDGVTHIINGNSAKTPAGTSISGGFTGWTMLGINPGAGLVGPNPSVHQRVSWLAAETHPWVDSLDISAAPTMLTDKSQMISASLTQGDHIVPVAWPVSAQWSGEGVTVIDSSTSQYAAEDSLAIFNQSTGELFALKPGTVTLTLTVNGRSESVDIQIKAQPAEPTDPGTPQNPGNGDEEGRGQGVVLERPSRLAATGSNSALAIASLAAIAMGTVLVTRRK